MCSRYDDSLPRRNSRVGARDVREGNVTPKTAYGTYRVQPDDLLRVGLGGTESRHEALLQEDRSEAKPYDFDD